MMKFLFYFSLLTPFIANAQKDKRDELNPDKLDVKEIKLEANESAPANIKLPFKRIQILDSRFDSSKIGFIINQEAFGKKRAFKKLVLRGGNANAIESYYNDYYAGSFTPNDFELLVVMKRFWISGKSSSDKGRIEVAVSDKYLTGVYCKWEYYIGKSGSYLPVKRKDTAFISDGNSEFNRIDRQDSKRLNFVKECLHDLVEMLDFSNVIIQFDKQPKKSFSEIEDFNRRMNDIPVLKDSGFKKGVYLNFADFKNNRPSIVDFQEKKMRYGTFNAHSEIYLEDKKGATISNYWAYSDGKDLRYGILGNEKMYRIQNTFCFFIKVAGYMIDQGDQGQLGPPGFNGVREQKYEIWVPFQIDMETGEIY